MKPKLNRKDQASQKKLRKKLSLGQALAGLFGGAREQPGSDKDSEEVPVFMTEGIIPRPGIRKPKIPPKPGSKGGSTVSNPREGKKE